MLQLFPHVQWQRRFGFQTKFQIIDNNLITFKFWFHILRFTPMVRESLLLPLVLIHYMNKYSIYFSLLGIIK